MSTLVTRWQLSWVIQYCKCHHQHPQSRLPFSELLRIPFSGALCYWMENCHGQFCSNTCCIHSSETKEQQPKKTNSNQQTAKSSKKKDLTKGSKKKDGKATFSHPWLTCSLKSHSQPILDMDFSANGKFLASCSEGEYWESHQVMSCIYYLLSSHHCLFHVVTDRTVVIWNIKDLEKKEHKCHRVNVELDHATQVKFSPDSKWVFLECGIPFSHPCSLSACLDSFRAIILNLFTANGIRVMKLEKKQDGGLGNADASIDFSQVWHWLSVQVYLWLCFICYRFVVQHHEAEIISIGIASNGNFIMTCAKDTSIIIWNLKGLYLPWDFNLLPPDIHPSHGLSFIPSGEVLGRIDTRHMNNSFAAVSPCGRFVGSCGEFRMLSEEVKSYCYNSRTFMICMQIRLNQFFVGQGSRPM